MTEANTDTTTTEGSATTEATTAATTTTDTGATTVDHAAEAEKWKNLSRKHEERAKANSTAAKELEELRAKSMSDQEKAVDEARKAGKAEGLAATGARLVKAEIRAAAAGRLSDDQLKTLVDNLNPAAFLTEDGDVDEEKVSTFVKGIAPQTDEETTTTTSPLVPDLGQGARGGDKAALNGDPILRSVKAKLGIS